MSVLRLFPLLVLPLFAQAPQGDRVVEAILREGKDNPQATAVLKALVTEIGPRLTASGNDRRACEWARDRFKSFGLGNARLEPWGTFPVGFRRGLSSGEMVAPRRMKLNFITMAWTPGTPGPREGAALILPGKASAVGPKQKGAWILVPGKADPKILAALEGAGVAGFIRPMPSDLLVMEGNHAIRWESLPSRVVVWLARTHVRAIRAHLAKKEEVRLRFDIRNEFVRGPTEVFNVVADIPGVVKPEEMVVVGAHLDSWDGATGTVDNGTGVATTLEAARLLMKAGARPKRTIRFILWTGEEQGLLGSAAWIRKHRALLPKISCVLVHDGGTNFISGIHATPAMRPIFERVFAPAKNLDKRMPFQIQAVERLPIGIGSDHDSFLMAGVPGFFWIQSGRANYFWAHHTQHDTLNQAIPEYQHHSATVVALAAWGLANEPNLLPREGIPRRRVPPRVLGVEVFDDGLTVRAVLPDSPAEKAGLRAGDRIMELGGRKVSNRRDLEVAKYRARREADIVVLRGGKRVSLRVRFE